jgi:hypothetical protein
MNFDWLPFTLLWSPSPVLQFPSYQARPIPPDPTRNRNPGNFPPNPIPCSCRRLTGADFGMPHNDELQTSSPWLPPSSSLPGPADQSTPRPFPPAALPAPPHCVPPRCTTAIPGARYVRPSCLVTRVTQHGLVCCAHGAKTAPRTSYAPAQLLPCRTDNSMGHGPA